jgi:hypothetical protein
VQVDARLMVAIRRAADAQERGFRRIYSPHGACDAVRLRWITAGQAQTVDVAVPSQQPVFLRWEMDTDGHAYQLLEVGGEEKALYPVLDPVSFEHAINVEQTILPEIFALYQADSYKDLFTPVHQFSDRFARFRVGHEETSENPNTTEARVCEIVKADINEQTPEAEVQRRIFMRFYQHATCDTDDYRRKAHDSLARLVERVNDLYAVALETIVSTLTENGFDEDEPLHTPGG